MDLIKEFLDDSKSIGKINNTTLEIYRKDIEDFDGFIVGKDLIDVDEKDVIQYIEKLKRKYSDRSVYRKISSIKSFYKYLYKNRIIDKFPVLNIELPSEVKKTTQPLEKWEINNILEVCGDSYEGKRDSLIIRLLCETGLKIGEILGLENKNLELVDYKVIDLYSHSKFISERISEKLSLDLKEFCTEYFKKVSPNKEEIFGELSRQSFRVRFINYAKKARITRDVSPNMIKKMVIEEKLKDEDGCSFLDKIRSEYMRIGIGDD